MYDKIIKVLLILNEKICTLKKVSHRSKGATGSVSGYNLSFNCRAGLINHQLTFLSQWDYRIALGVPWAYDKGVC